MDGLAFAVRSIARNRSQGIMMAHHGHVWIAIVTPGFHRGHCRWADTKKMKLSKVIKGPSIAKDRVVAVGALRSTDCRSALEIKACHLECCDPLENDLQRLQRRRAIVSSKLICSRIVKHRRQHASPCAMRQQSPSSLAHICF